MTVQDLFSLDGKVALVTGGGRGIGHAIATAYLEAGAHVVITGRRTEYLDAAVAAFTDRGLECLAVVADVTQPAGVAHSVAQALDRYGAIDILVNNAGQTWGQATEDLPLEKWQGVIAVNLTGLFLMAQAVGRHMLERAQGGRIVNIASVAGLTGGDPEATKTIAYNTSKAGVIGFTRTLAREWGRHHVLVNAIAPGRVSDRVAPGTIDATKAR